MADKKLPFDDDTMTLIMGLGGPEEPGQHGRTSAEGPGKTAIDLITEIKDLCEEFLLNNGKEEESEVEESEEPEEEEVE